jgi:Cyclo-malto-dextrinase C-terminal domain
MYKENIGGKTKAYEVISNQEIDFENGLEIEGKRAMIMELK